jgi:hypothetical protein
VQPENGEIIKGDNANEDADLTSHDTQTETSTRGASAAGTTENNVEAEVLSSAVLVTESP